MRRCHPSWSCWSFRCQKHRDSRAEVSGDTFPIHPAREPRAPSAAEGALLFGSSCLGVNYHSPKQ